MKTGYRKVQLKPGRDGLMVTSVTFDGVLWSPYLSKRTVFSLEETVHVEASCSGVNITVESIDGNRYEIWNFCRPCKS